MAKDSAKNSVKPVSGYEVENTGGILSGFLADEDDFDRRSLLRLGTWGVASVGAVIVAVLANQSSIGMRREQVAAIDLARQSQQIQSVARESQNETRRLASAIDTLNGDRDRLYSRVSVVEQGLEAVTGSIARQNTAATAPPPAAASTPPATAAELPAVPQTPPPVIAPVATTVAAVADRPKVDGKPPVPAPATVGSIAPTPATANLPATPAPFMASKSIMAPPDAAASKLIEPAAPAKTATAASAPDVVASVTAQDSLPKDSLPKDSLPKDSLPKDSVPKDGSPKDNAPSMAKDSPAKNIPAKDSAAPDASSTLPSTVAVQRTEFAVDVGGANSVSGLRSLWRGLIKSRSNAPLAALHPIIVVKESNTGMGMQLRLVAGPLGDAAAAAKICAAMIENDRSCETTVFDGQRLAMKADEPPASARSGSGKPDADKSSADKPVSDKSGSDKSGSDKAAAVDPDAVKHTADNPVLMRPGSGKPPYSYRRHSTRRTSSEDPPPKKPESTASTISSFFSRRTN